MWVSSFDDSTTIHGLHMSAQSVLSSSVFVVVVVVDGHKGKKGPKPPPPAESARTPHTH